GRERGGGVVGPVGEVIAEEWCGEGCVDEACGDQVDADRRELEREVGDEGGERDRGCRGDSEASSWAACARAAHEYQGAGRPDLVGGATCDLEREQQVPPAAASPLLRRHFEQRPVVGSAGGDHHVIGRGREILEERLRGGRIGGVEGRGALRVELERCLLEAFWIAPGEDDTGALGAGAPGGFQPDAGAAADDDDGLAEQFRFPPGGYSSGCGGHGSSGGWCGRDALDLMGA